MSETNSEAGHTPRKQLGFAKAFKVSEWISCNQERILDMRPSWAEAAEWATKDLGFEVTPANMQTVAEGANQKWTPKRQGNKSGSSNLWDAIKTCQAKVDEAAKLIEQLLLDNQNLHSQLAVLRGTIVTIIKEANLKVTPSFAARNDAPRTNVAGK